MIKEILALLSIFCLLLSSGAISKADEIQTLQYKQEEIRDTSTRTRKRAQVAIYLADPAAKFTPDQLAATCAAAAKFYSQKLDLKLVGVFLSDIPGTQSWEGTRLAQCNYSPDNGGASGDQGWKWDSFQVANEPLSDQQREMKKLWGEMRADYQKNGSTDEEELSKAIARTMKIKPEEVTLPFFFLEVVDFRKFENTPAQGPLAN